MKIYTCDLEQKIANALKEENIIFESNAHRLDFFLPDFNVYIEIKKYHSERSNSQLQSQENIILIQGKKAVDLFCNIIKREKDGKFKSGSAC